MTLIFQRQVLFILRLYSCILHSMFFPNILELDVFIAPKQWPSLYTCKHFMASPLLQTNLCDYLHECTPTIWIFLLCVGEEVPICLFFNAYLTFIYSLTKKATLTGKKANCLCLQCEGSLPLASNALGSKKHFTQILIYLIIYICGK